MGRVFVLVAMLVVCGCSNSLDSVNTSDDKSKDDKCKCDCDCYGSAAAGYIIGHQVGSMMKR